MARVYVSKKINDMIQPYQDVITNYYVLGEHKMIYPAYVIVSISEIKQWKDHESLTIIAVLEDEMTRGWINTYGHNYMKKDPYAIGLLIQVLSSSRFYYINHKEFCLEYKKSLESNHHSYEPINKKNKWIKFLKGHALPLFIGTSFLCLGVVLMTLLMFNQFALFDGWMWLKMVGVISLFEILLILGTSLVNYLNTLYLQRQMKMDHCLIKSNAYTFYSLHQDVISLQLEE